MAHCRGLSKAEALIQVQLLDGTSCEALEKTPGGHVERERERHQFLVKLARDLTKRPFSPQKVAFRKGNGNPYFREIWVGEIL